MRKRRLQEELGKERSGLRNTETKGDEMDRREEVEKGRKGGNAWEKRKDMHVKGKKRCTGNFKRKRRRMK